MDLKHIYKYGDGVEQIRQETQTIIELESVDTENEVLLYVKGAQFPCKSYPHGQSVFTTNVLKSIVLEAVRYATKTLFIPATIYTLLFNLESVIDSFNRIGFKLVSPYIIKEHNQMVFTREFQFLIFNFLINLGIPEEKADRTAELLAHIMETDDAYRTRFQDMFTTIGSLEPKYIKDYIKLSVERDDHVVSKKIKLFGTLARIALFVPKLRNAWGLAIKSIDISKLQLDDIDIYWSAYKTGYKYQGLTQEERRATGEAKGWKYI